MKQKIIISHWKLTQFSAMSRQGDMVADIDANETSGEKNVSTSKNPPQGF